MTEAQPKLLLLLHSGGFERAYQAASLAVTAAAMGEQVTVALFFEALRDLCSGRFGLPRADEVEAAARAAAHGVPLPAQLLREARKLGARLVACDTAARIAGVEATVLRGSVDEVLGLPSIWRLGEGGRVLSL